MSAIISRRFADKDKEELNDLYNFVAGCSRTIEQFEWEWLNTPEGWGSMWILEDSDTGKIVGHHGLIPIKFNFFGTSILTGKTENTVMHPQYRGKGIYYPFEVKFLQEAKERFQLLYTTAGVAEQGKIRIKLGYASVGSYAHYIQATKRSHLDRMVANIIYKRVHNKFIAALLIGVAKLGSVILMPLFSRRGSIDRAVKLRKVISIDAVAEELDRLWERNKGKFGITIDRNSRYLKWRIFDNPNLTYEFFLAERQGDVVGYVITKSHERAGVKLRTIVDIIADDNNEVIFNSILTRVVGTFREKGIYIVHFPTLLSGNSLNKALKRNGFMSFPILWKVIRKVTGRKESLLQAKALDDNLDPAKVADPACWYFTDLFKEGAG